MSWPVTPPAWTLPWVIWRFRNQEGPKPAGVPKEIPKWAWGFLKWVAWRRKGAIPPRPVSSANAPIPAKIPQWAWGVLRGLAIAVPIEPPPPPPPPPWPVPGNSWNLPSPLMFTSWGWMTDSAFRTDAALQNMAEAGIRTVAIQVGLYQPDVPERIRAIGAKVALWGEPSGADGEALERAEADGYLPQVETVEQYRNAIRNLEGGIGAGLSLSTITTLSGMETFMRRPNGTAENELTTVEYEALVDAGLTHGWIECYDWDMQPTSVNEMMFGAKQRGFYYANPCIGLARANVYVSSYQPPIERYGRQIGVYLAEPMRPLDWQAVKAI